MTAPRDDRIPRGPARVEVYRTRSLRRSQRYAWRARAANGRIIATSGEGYSDEATAANMAWLVMSGAYDDPALLVVDEGQKG